MNGDKVGILRRRYRQVIVNKTNTIQHYFVFGNWYGANPGQRVVVEKVVEINDLSTFNVFIDSCDGTLTYVGYAEYGVKENEPHFAIKKYIIDGTVERWLWAKERFMACRWDKRETYDYGST